MPDWAFDVFDNYKYSFNVNFYFGIINHLKLKLNPVEINVDWLFYMWFELNTFMVYHHQNVYILQE